MDNRMIKMNITSIFDIDISFIVDPGKSEIELVVKFIACKIKLIAQAITDAIGLQKEKIIKGITRQNSILTIGIIKRFVSQK